MWSKNEQRVPSVGCCFILSGFFDRGFLPGSAVELISSLEKLSVVEGRSNIAFFIPRVTNLMV